MQKRKRKNLHSFLDKTFGKPLNMTDKQRLEIVAAFSGWIKQSPRGVILPYEVRDRLREPRLHTKHPGDELSENKWIGRHINNALSAYSLGSLRGHWSIVGVVSMPSLSPVIQKSLSQYQQSKVTKNDYDHIRDLGHKSVEIAIAPTFHRSVAAHGINRDGRKLVQAVWDHRVYGDIEVWQCSFWDFNCLSHDKDSWKKATHHTGYVAKTGTHVSVDVSFAKAMALVRRKTVQGAIKSIVSDFGDDDQPG